MTGLASDATLVLQNNASDDLALVVDGNFTFSNPVSEGGDYAVSVRTQPQGQRCTVSDATGKATSEVRSVTVACAETQAQVTTLAGSGSKGNADGTGSAAAFNGPVSVVVDAGGVLYVTDTGNRVIRKITPVGAVTTFAGSGSQGKADGKGTAASFDYPAGIAMDASGNAYVADRDNQVIRKIASTADVATLTGLQSPVAFLTPFGVAMDADGNVYVADSSWSAIFKISTVGKVTTFAGNGFGGSNNGTGIAASFDLPLGLAADAGGNIYVADYGNHMIRKITPAGVVTTLAGSRFNGKADGTGTAASFNGPRGLAVDANGNVYVADTGNHLIRKITPAGVVTTLAGSGTQGKADGTAPTASFSNPYSVAVDTSGNVYVADTGNHLIRKITP